DFQQMACYLTIGLSLFLFAFDFTRHVRTGLPASADPKVLGIYRDLDQPIVIQRERYRDWLRVCQWARLSTSPDEVFLTPRQQQTFKWYAHRAEVVNRKDVPQDAASLVKWQTRFFDVFPRHLDHMRVSINYGSLRRLRDQYDVRYMVVDRRISTLSLPLVKLYPRNDEENPTYAVYELPYD
ncbi:MAG: DUF6798 domain-containing protein, partial [Planctomycetota bacterium]